MVGKHVFCLFTANFNTFRCAEQIRNDIDYHKLKVTIVSAGSGVYYGNLGYSHHAYKIILKVFPKHVDISPGDDMELNHVWIT